MKDKQILKEKNITQMNEA